MSRPFSEDSIFFGEIELFHLRGFVKDGVKPTKIQKCGFYDTERLENALRASNMGKQRTISW
jgi:hypothetical protein